MKTKTKVIAGVAAAFLIVMAVMGFVGGGLYYINRRLHDPALRAKLDKAWDDGEAFGKTTDQNGCLAKGLTFTDSADIFDLTNSDFDTGCFITCQPSPGFCDGVPKFFDRNWTDDQCSGKRENKEACLSVFHQKLSSCQIGGG